MMQYMVDNQEQEQLAMEEVLTSQLLDFSAEDAELFSEALLCSSCDFSSDDPAAINNTTATTSTRTTTTTATTDLPSSFEKDFWMDPATLSAFLDSQLSDAQHDELITSINCNNNCIDNNNNNRYSEPTMLVNQQDQFQIMGDEYSTAYPVGAMLAQVYENCLMPGGMLGRVGMDPGGSASSCSYMDPGIGRPIYNHHQGGINVSRDGQLEFYSGLAGMGMGLQETADHHSGTGGVTIGMHYGMDTLQHAYGSNSTELQVFGDQQQQQQQQLMHTCSSPTQVKDMSSLDESTFKVGRLSAEERKEKIHRYMKKRNERNFTKKIKYACRKTLADSRPRVRGRFAKNDDSGEPTRPSSSHNEYEDDEEVVVKEENMFDSSDILAHINGVNSFKFNYALESWI